MKDRMLELVICDDEKRYRSDLKKLLGTELELSGISYHITEFSCGEDLIKGFRDKDYQIVFLDIEMGKTNGVETAKRVRLLNRQAVIIFVTSHPDFVFQGYEVRALNYIMKPYEPSKIVSVLHTALQELEISEEKYYVVEQRSGSVRVPLSEIQYIFSEKRLLHMVTKSEKYTFYGKLDDLESLSSAAFVRIHNRYLVHLKYIERIDGNTVLIDGDALPVSRSCKAALSIAFAKYMLNES